MKTPGFWYPQNPGLISLAATALTPLGWLYDGAGRVKSLVTRPYDPGVPVICVGNLTVGGTGKTPVAMAIGRWLDAQGSNPWFLSRGHGGLEKGPLRVDPDRDGASDVGDEPLLLASTAPTVVSRDRAAGAAFAVRHGAGAIVMDDGFQNPSVKKRLSLVVVDAGALFGNGRVVPAGPLRESVARGLSRADAVIVMGAKKPPEGIPNDRLAGALSDFAGPVFHGRLTPDATASDALGAGPYVAFAGIGRPSKFFATAKQAGFTLVAEIPFPDHHRFTQQDLDTLEASARRLDARLLTTQKDAVRLPQGRFKDLAVLPVSAHFDHEPALWRLFSDKLTVHR